VKIMMLPTWFGGVSWWRFEKPAEALRAAGHEVYIPTSEELQHQTKTKNPFEWMEEKIQNYDILHVGYAADQSLPIALFKFRDKYNIPIVVDIDDDLDHVPTYNKGRSAFYPGSVHSRVVKTQLMHADGVTFSTPPLAETLAYLVKNNLSAVLGNWANPDDFDYSTPKERHEDQSIRLMVTGGSGRYGDWEIFEEPLKWAMAHYDGTGGKPMLRLFFMGGTPAWVLPYMSDKLNPEANRVFYIQPTPDVTLFNKVIRYVSPDIIISPVQTNDFNRSKSGLKFLEAALVGAAFLCTDYPTYEIAPKGSCLKVDNIFTQWQESLSALIEDKKLRAKLVDSARDFVLENALAEHYVRERVEFYSKVISARRASMCQSSSQEVGLVPESAPETS